jgi:hypothetical protein
MIFTSVLSGIEKSFHDRYDISSTIIHKGERGRQRENGLLIFLRETLPAAYGVASGEIIPFKGASASPQCDIIIYDRLRMPILGKSEAVQQVPLESVYGVIECKSVIDKTALKDTEDKIRKIQALPRARSKTRLRKGMRRGPFYMLFGYKLKTQINSCLQFMEIWKKSLDVNVFALDSGCGIWIIDRPRTVWLEATDPSQNVYETLAIFYVGLLEALREIDLGNPSFMEMIFTYQ